MQRIKSFDHPEQGALYLVATPIGNLSEISSRTRQVLEEADWIACEDTRVSSKLLAHLGISKPLLSHHEHNEKKATEKILSLLQEGKKVALLSDAGYPLISDPGSYLVQSVLALDCPIVPVSGPNAALNALVASGLDARHYLYYGFLDAKSSRRKKELETLSQIPYTLLFYEAPHRIQAMLEDLLEVLGDRTICLCRELTKLHEEFIHGTISEILPVAGELRGEMVVVVSGYEKKADLDQALEEVRRLMEQGMKGKQACREVSERTGLGKNELYQKILEMKDEE